ncbi:hypothetical protein Sxan_32730 [Streptomyces xanthophaeus]|uniref:Uncharacterized protein n=1 Tax=Streptomyces xanthophaeus TaxID=67385 RepID=A0A919LIW6_9ACTN|nr:hypothetical protein Sxan_32730 [Streptomyces xanthophaeus]
MVTSPGLGQWANSSSAAAKTAARLRAASLRGLRSGIEILRLRSGPAVRIVHEEADRWSVSYGTECLMPATTSPADPYRPSPRLRDYRNALAVEASGIDFTGSSAR